MKYDSYLHLLTCWEQRKKKKKKRDEQTAAERTKTKSWFHFPQDFLGLGKKYLCYQKTLRRRQKTVAKSAMI